MMKPLRRTAFIVAAILPLAACEAGNVEEEGMDTELETVEPAGETAMTPGTTSPYTLTTYDSDANQQLTRDEWGGWYEEQGTYGDWNANADEGLDENELTEGVFGAWNADGAEGLTETEWNEGVGGWFGDADYGAWGEWDANGDSVLDRSELREGFETRNLYDRVDRDSDALIDDEELADWWFDIWDGNDDDLIDTTEWDQVGNEFTRIGTTTTM